MIKPEDAASQYPLGPALDFLQRIWQLNHALEQLSSRMEKRLGVTAQQRLIVRCVGKFPGLTAGQLATLLHVDPGTVSASLSRLQRKGLVERRPDPRDRRRASLGLTAKGRALDRPADGTVEAAVERLLETTPERDLATMAKVVEQLTALLGQVQAEPSRPVRAAAGKRPRPRNSPAPRAERSSSRTSRSGSAPGPWPPPRPPSR
jgi:DNA-binding MarR family transcriptional regulator